MLNKIIQLIKKYIYPISLYARQIASAVLLLLVARYLAVYDFGIFSSYKNIIVYIFVLANLNYSDYILVSSKANPNRAKRKIAIFMLNAILLGIIYSVTSFFCNIEQHTLFLLIIINTFLDNVFSGLILPYFQSTKRFIAISIMNIAYAIGILFSAIIAFMLKLSLLKLLSLCIIIGLINFIVCSCYANIKYLVALTKINKYIKLLDKKIFGYIVTAINGNLYTPLPAIFAATMVAKGQAALFFAAYTLATIPLFLISAQNQKVIALLMNVSNDVIKKTMKENFKFVLFVTISIFLFFLILGKFALVMFYGQEYYENAYFVLLMLLFANILYGLALNYWIYITASGNQAKTIPIQLRLLVLSFVMLCILSKLGIYGAAISYLITMTYMLISYRKFSNNYLCK